MRDGSSNSDWAESFASFHAKHRGPKGKKIAYTIVFNTAIESLLVDSEVPLEWRVLAYIWRMSWGNNSDFAVDRIDGKQIGQSACAEALSVDKRRVSDAVSLLRGLGYLLPKKGPTLHPSDCLPGADSGAELGSKVRTPADFSAFLDVWKVRSPADFQELRSAEATVKRLKIVRLGRYREWKRERTNDGSSLYTTPTTQQGEAPTSSSALVVPAPTVNAEEEDLYSTFKGLYPSRMFDEPKAKPSFRVLMPDEQRKCIERLHIYLQCKRWQDGKGKWIPLASNWLKSYECDPPPLFKKQDQHEKQVESIELTVDIARVMRGGGSTS